MVLHMPQVKSALMLELKPSDAGRPGTSRDRLGQATEAEYRKSSRCLAVSCDTLLHGAATKSWVGVVIAH